MPQLHLPSSIDPIDYVVVGEGPPIVFVHGAPGDLRTWAPVIGQLADRYRCVSYTQRWFGDRTWASPGSAFGTESHAADLCDLVAALELAPVAVVAWSYAGHVAFLAAQRRPDLFGRMLVYEPSVGTYVTDPVARAQMDADAARMFPPLAEALAQGDMQEVVRRLIDASGGPGWFDRQPAEQRAIHLASAPMMPLLMGGGTPPADLRAEDLVGLQAPITIAWGAETRDLFRVPSKAAAARLSRGDHFEVPGAGHLLPEADPVRFASLVADWMARRPGITPP